MDKMIEDDMLIIKMNLSWLFMIKLKNKLIDVPGNGKSTIFRLETRGKSWFRVVNADEG